MLWTATSDSFRNRCDDMRLMRGVCQRLGERDRRKQTEARFGRCAKSTVGGLLVEFPVGRKWAGPVQRCEKTTAMTGKINMEQKQHLKL